MHKMGLRPNETTALFWHKADNEALKRRQRRQQPDFNAERASKKRAHRASLRKNGQNEVGFFRLCS